MAALVLAVPCAVAMVVVARWPRGGWVRRFLPAAALGLVAGLAEAVAMAGAGWSYGWLPVAGVAAAAALALTRRPPARPESGPALAAPIRFGDYRLGDWFARTGTADVYGAVTSGGTPALVKVAAPDRAGEPAVRLRLEREARVLADLAHPNCIQLREVIGGDGAPVLVFENVDGVPLSQLLAAGLAGPPAVATGLEVLAGLAAVHARGLVHRWVEPDQIWLDRSGRALLAGFELACPGVEHPLAPEAGPFASPEQRAGAVLDGRADLWSVAAVLRAVLGERAPAPVAQVLAGALAEEPDRRPGTAEAFADALRSAAEQADQAVRADRQALAAAVTAHGAIGAAAAGWALGAGGGGASGAAGLGAGTLGAAPGGSAGLGAAGSSTGVGASTGTGTSAATGTTTSTAAAAGKAGTATTAACAAAAAAVLGVVPVLVDPELADPAGPEPVIALDEAHQIVTATVTEPPAEDTPDLQDLLAEVGAVAPDDLSEVVVGVPCGEQADGVFFASAQLAAREGVVFLFFRFRRDDRGDWALVNLLWSVEDLGTPRLDGDDCLARVEDPGTLVLDPAAVPDEYASWVAGAADQHLPADVLQVPGELASDSLAEWLERVAGAARGTTGRVEVSAATGEADVVPLADGQARVLFTATVDSSFGLDRSRYDDASSCLAGTFAGRTTTYRFYTFEDGRLDVSHAVWDTILGPPEFEGYRQVDLDYVMAVAALVPAAPEEPDAPVPRVLIDDTTVRSRTSETVPCG